MTGNQTVVQVGMRVYGADGEEIGSVKEVSDHHFLLDRRLQRDLYVPRDAVAEEQDVGHHITLIISSEHLNDQGWEHPPLIGNSDADTEAESAATIEPLIVTPIDTIDADASLADAISDLDAKDLRALLVLENQRPVGVLLLRDVRNLTGAPAEQPVRTRMQIGAPVLTPDLSLAAARARLYADRPEWLAAVDTIPVVDDEGLLIGEVEHAAIEGDTRTGSNLTA